jgi:hypothetical protein
MCFAGGGGITTGAQFALGSCGCSDGSGRISGRFSLSPGIVDPSKPKGRRSSELPSSSGLAQAFPFLNLPSFARTRQFEPGLKHAYSINSFQK